MSAIFYDHLIPWEKVDILIETIGVAGDEKIELIELIDETIHTEILIIIMTHLPKEKHEEFIDRFHEAPHNTEHLVFLKSQGADQIEDHIRLRAEQIIDELLTEVME